MGLRLLTIAAGVAAEAMATMITMMIVLFVVVILVRPRLNPLPFPRETSPTGNTTTTTATSRDSVEVIKPLTGH